MCERPRAALGRRPAAPGIKVSVFTVDKFIDVPTKTTLKKTTLVIVGNPIDALKLRKNGLGFDYLNVSGMRFNDQRTRVHKNMSVTPEEREAFKELDAMGVEPWMQPTTRDEKARVMDLLAKVQ